MKKFNSAVMIFAGMIGDFITYLAAAHRRAKEARDNA